MAYCVLVLPSVEGCDWHTQFLKTHELLPLTQSLMHWGCGEKTLLLLTVHPWWKIGNSNTWNLLMSFAHCWSQFCWWLFLVWNKNYWPNWLNLWCYMRGIFLWLANYCSSSPLLWKNRYNSASWTKLFSIESWHRGENNQLNKSYHIHNSIIVKMLHTHRVWIRAIWFLNRLCNTWTITCIKLLLTENGSHVKEYGTYNL